MANTIANPDRILLNFMQIRFSTHCNQFIFPFNLKDNTIFLVRALHIAITTQYVSGSSIKNRLILLYTINRFLGEAKMTEIDAHQL